MKPQVVLKEEDTNTGSQKNIGSEEVRQIVSAETSKELRDMLRSVVATGTGRNAEVKGFSVGGKSGTSEPDYSDKTAEYIASFMGVAPTTDPEYAVLVIIRAPKGKSRQGGQVAAPVVSQILKDIFTNTKLVTNAERTEANANEIKTKDFIGKTVKEVNEIEKAEGINVELNSKNQETYVIPKWHIEDWEVAKDTAVREISEETWLDIKDLEVIKFITKLNYTFTAWYLEANPVIDKDVYLFLVKYNWQKEPTVQKEERFVWYEWFSLEEIKNIKVMFDIQTIIWRNKTFFI